MCVCYVISSCSALGISSPSKMTKTKIGTKTGNIKTNTGSFLLTKSETEVKTSEMTKHE